MTSIRRTALGTLAALTLCLAPPTLGSGASNGGPVQELPLEGAADALAASSGLVFVDFYADW